MAVGDAPSEIQAQAQVLNSTLVFDDAAPVPSVIGPPPAWAGDLAALVPPSLSAAAAQAGFAFPRVPDPTAAAETFGMVLGAIRRDLVPAAAQALEVAPQALGVVSAAAALSGAAAGVLAGPAAAIPVAGAYISPVLAVYAPLAKAAGAAGGAAAGVMAALRELSRSDPLAAIRAAEDFLKSGAP